MTPIIKSYVIVDHSDKCIYTGRFENPWSGIPSGTFWSDKVAGTKKIRGKKSNNHLWVKVTCNDPRCKGIKAVHSSVLVDA